MKILIVKLSAIGDVIHALPVAAYLKKALPDAHISWLVEKASLDLVSNNPAVDEPIVFSGKKWLSQIGQSGNWWRNISEARTFFADLRKANYDVVIELQGLLKSSLLARATGARVVAGFDDTREFADRFLTHKLNVGDYFGHDVPVVELNLRIAHYVLEVLGAAKVAAPVEFPLPAVPSSLNVKMSAILQAPYAESIPGVASVAWAEALPEPIKGAPDSGPPVAPTPATPPIPLAASIPNLGSEVGNPINIVLIPGTTWVTKIWPVEKWVGLGVSLGFKYRCQIVLVGGPAEIETNHAITAGIEAKRPGQLVVNLTSQTSLLELIPLFRKSALVIGADTGPLHLAAATGTPKVVGVYGSTPWRRNGPYGSQCESISLALDCQPCYSKTCKLATVACLTDLDSSLVFDAAVRALG